MPIKIKMVIKFDEAKQEGYNRMLKLGKMEDFESVIVQKLVAEPAKGTSSYGEWSLYSLHVVSMTSKDRNGPYTENVAEDMSFFPSKKLAPQMENLPINKDIKISVEFKESAKGTYPAFKAELVGGQAVETTANNVDPKADLKSRVATLKSAGMTAQEVVAVLSKEFDVGDEMIVAVWEAN